MFVSIAAQDSYHHRTDAPVCNTSSSPAVSAIEIRPPCCYSGIPALLVDFSRGSSVRISGCTPRGREDGWCKTDCVRGNLDKAVNHDVSRGISTTPSTMLTVSGEISTTPSTLLTVLKEISTTQSTMLTVSETISTTPSTMLTVLGEISTTPSTIADCVKGNLDNTINHADCVRGNLDNTVNHALVQLTADLRAVSTRRPQHF